MKETREGGTRGRLLNAACVHFAARGYRSTTLQEICADAQANIAAVNYHFGSKLELYRAVWAHAVEQTDAAYPVPEEVGANPLAWIKTLITQRLRTVFDSGSAGWLPDLIRRELMAPSPLHEQVVRDRIHGNQRRVRTAVQAYLGKAATEGDVRLCSAMVTSSFVMFNMGKTIRERHGKQPPTLDAGRQQHAIDLSLAFHVGGLQALRRTLTAREARP